MKTAGIIGGMSWESTALYYKWLNEGVRARLGGLHSAKVALTSVDFEVIAAMQKAGQWDEAGQAMATEARKLEAAGADFVLLATNTMHQVAGQIQSAISIPFVHIADATANRIMDAKIGKIGLLGTLFTMERDFYKGRLKAHGIETIVPDQDTRQMVHEVIYEELCKGKVEPSSKDAFVRAAYGLMEQGAEGVILGCTEITLLIDQRDFPFPVFDTTKIHIEQALDLMLG